MDLVAHAHVAAEAPPRPPKRPAAAPHPAPPAKRRCTTTITFTATVEHSGDEHGVAEIAAIMRAFQAATGVPVTTTLRSAPGEAGTGPSAPTPSKKPRRDKPNKSTTASWAIELPTGTGCVFTATLATLTRARLACVRAHAIVAFGCCDLAPTLVRGLVKRHAGVKPATNVRWHGEFTPNVFKKRYNWKEPAVFPAALCMRLFARLLATSGRIFCVSIDHLLEMFPGVPPNMAHMTFNRARVAVKLAAAEAASVAAAMVDAFALDQHHGHTVFAVFAATGATELGAPSPSHVPISREIANAACVSEAFAIASWEKAVTRGLTPTEVCIVRTCAWCAAETFTVRDAASLFYRAGLPLQAAREEFARSREIFDAPPEDVPREFAQSIMLAVEATNYHRVLSQVPAAFRRANEQ